MRVERIELKDVGAFDDAVPEIPPPAPGQRGELVLFEGPNGSGKTTLAQVIACACDRDREGKPGGLLAGPDDPRLGAPMDALRRRFRQQGSTADLTVTVGHEGARLAIRDSGAQPLSPLSEWRGEPAALLTACSTAVQRLPSQELSWAAFAYRGHQKTPSMATKGPAEIPEHPLFGALSFGSEHPASEHFGQLLVNLDYDLAKATLAAVEAAKNSGSDGAVASAEHRAETSRRALGAIQEAISTALGRRARLEFPSGKYKVRILIDDESIPVDLLGEGMRSTLSWLSDLLVRLFRIPWRDPQIPPNEQVFWLILDEVDESLHPRMQMRLVPTLRRLFPNAHIYMTTHSPFVVASAGEGFVFPIRPDEDHRVRGRIEPQALHPGQSLEWVIEEIFEAATGFIDPRSQEALRAHEADVVRLRRREVLHEAEWQAFIERRARLFAMGEEVQTMVAMQEVPVRGVIEEAIVQRGRGGDATVVSAPRGAA